MKSFLDMLTALRRLRLAYETHLASAAIKRVHEADYHHTTSEEPHLAAWPPERPKQKGEV